jgi:hypothetical protein
MYGWLNHMTLTFPEESENHPSVAGLLLRHNFLASSLLKSPTNDTFVPGTSPATVPEAPPRS